MSKNHHATFFNTLLTLALLGAVGCVVWMSLRSKPAEREIVGVHVLHDEHNHGTTRYGPGEKVQLRMSHPTRKIPHHYPIDWYMHVDGIPQKIGTSQPQNIMTYTLPNIKSQNVQFEAVSTYDASHRAKSTPITVGPHVLLEDGVGSVEGEVKTNTNLVSTLQVYHCPLSLTSVADWKVELSSSSNFSHVVSASVTNVVNHTITWRYHVETPAMYVRFTSQTLKTRGYPYEVSVVAPKRVTFAHSFSVNANRLAQNKGVIANAETCSLDIQTFTNGNPRFGYFENNTLTDVTFSWGNCDITKAKNATFSSTNTHMNTALQNIGPITAEEDLRKYWNLYRYYRQLTIHNATKNEVVPITAKYNGVALAQTEVFVRAAFLKVVTPKFNDKLYVGTEVTSTVEVKGYLDPAGYTWRMGCGNGSTFEYVYVTPTLVEQVVGTQMFQVTWTPPQDMVIFKGGGRSGSYITFPQRRFGLTIEATPKSAGGSPLKGDQEVGYYRKFL